MTVLTDSSEVITDEYTHDAWGRLRDVLGSTANSQLFKGEYLAYRQDPHAGPDALFGLHHRHYASEIGRFTSEDPAADDLNLYRYVGNNPVNAADPSGLGPEQEYVVLPTSRSPQQRVSEPQADVEGRYWIGGKPFTSLEFYQLVPANSLTQNQLAEVRQRLGLSSVEEWQDYQARIQQNIEAEAAADFEGVPGAWYKTDYQQHVEFSHLRREILLKNEELRKSNPSIAAKGYRQKSEVVKWPQDIADEEMLNDIARQVPAIFGDRSLTELEQTRVLQIVYRHKFGQWGSLAIPGSPGNDLLYTMASVWATRPISRPPRVFTGNRFTRVQRQPLPTEGGKPPKTEGVTSKGKVDAPNSVLTRNQIITNAQEALGELAKQFPAAKVGFRGSLARGTKGAHKGGGPFDPTNYDVDAFIVSDKLAAMVPKNADGFRNLGRLGEHNGLIKEIGDRLRSIPGHRQGTVKIRVFSEAEFQALSPDEVFLVP